VHGCFLKGEGICLAKQTDNCRFVVTPARPPQKNVNAGSSSKSLRADVTTIFYRFMEIFTTGENCEFLDYLAHFAKNPIKPWNYLTFPANYVILKKKVRGENAWM
jgi:hypothetical protein